MIALQLDGEEPGGNFILSDRMRSQVISTQWRQRQCHLRYGRIGRSSIKRNKGYNGGLKRKPSVGPTWLEAGEKEKLAGREENEHGL